MLHTATIAEYLNSISVEDSGYDPEARMMAPFAIRPPDSIPDMRIGRVCLKYILKVKVRKVVETRMKPEIRE